MRVYTLGYEKRTITEYIQILKEAEVDVLVDVREIPWSYKRDFCKVKFSSVLKDAGIEYVHIRALGNPKKFRRSGLTPKEILKMYKSYLKKTEAGILPLIELFNGAKRGKQNICLTCFERDSSCCHRSIIADHLHPKIKNLNIKHL